MPATIEADVLGSMLAEDSGGTVASIVLLRENHNHVTAGQNVIEMLTQMFGFPRRRQGVD